MPIKYEVKRTVRGAENYFEVELGDYKPVQGVLFPFSFAIGAKGSSGADKQQYSWERITLNVNLDDTLIHSPAAGDKSSCRPPTPQRRGAPVEQRASSISSAGPGAGFSRRARTALHGRRFRNHVRARRAQHRLRCHERSHRGARGGT